MAASDGNGRTLVLSLSRASEQPDLFRPGWMDGLVFHPDGP